MGWWARLYPLWWHISEQQDFDRHYLTWYLVQPLLGLVLGGIVFLLMAGGFLLLQVNLQDPNAATAAPCCLTWPQCWPASARTSSTSNSTG